MNPLMKLHPILFSSALVAVVAQAGLASVTSITSVRLNPTAAGLDLVFETEGGENSNVFTVNQGNTLRADITRAQLNLPNGVGFTQDNPAPGIRQISVAPLDANSVRITVSGTSQAPVGEIESNGDRVVLSISSDGQAAQAPTPVPEELVTVPAPATPSAVAQAAPEESAAPEVPAPASPDVLVPNPDVTIDGTPVPQPQLQQAPPFLPRAVAPPVGDIAVAENQILSTTLDLGSNERIPKLLLRDAPAREVLSLLARTAGLNVVFATGAPAAGAAEGGGGEGPTVSLDIENESVQDVFNHVLRVTGLQANRVGRSIYVGPQLPDSARTVASRTLRLNQVDAIEAAGFLASLGAIATQTVNQEVTEVITIESEAEGVPPIQRVVTTNETTIEPLTYVPEQGESFVARPLQGLQAVADNRLNSLTIVGEPRLITLASEYLTRLDLRRRQVAVNIKIIDVNLSAIDRFGISFSSAIGSTNFLSTGGAGVINFGGQTPAGVATPLSPGSIAGNPASSAFSVPGEFLLQIQAQITNGNAKILTDPTLVVQEGQAASIALTQEVVTNITTTISASTPPVTTTTVEKEPAGLTLSLQVEGIDDNGFVSLNVSPRITSLTSSQQINTGSGANTIALLAEREVSSGTVRLRDGQTLLLTGIIQESERSTISKVPILGDLPILGALFRSTSTEGLRNEVLVMLTPQILDDSDQSVFGYGYTPSEQVQEVLENRGSPE
ncbi:MAG TPA: AMIN domain-containing protein [Nodosilinea sp.]|nr:AMIN domain-containing protein [Nodosilinea sp.]